jgi:SAM-dependent methyltransferase
MTNEADKAGEAYWTQYWKTVSIPPLLEPHQGHYAHLQTRIYHQFIRKHLPESIRGGRVLEIGCANSVWLPYFYQEFDMNVYGLDYSETGCEMERQLLERYQIPGQIHHADFHVPPRELEGQMDLVISMGVLEHFTDSVDVIRAFSRYLKPGGFLLTTVPNMPGITGVLQKAFYKPVYDIHVPLSLHHIDDAAKKAGLLSVAGEYGLTPSFYLVLQSTAGRANFYRFKWLINKVLIYITKGCWWIQTNSGIWSAHPFWSASIFHMAKKPG